MATCSIPRIRRESANCRGQLNSGAECKLSSQREALIKRMIMDNAKTGRDVGARQVRIKEEHRIRWKGPTHANMKEVSFSGDTWCWACGKNTGGKCEKLRAHKPKESKCFGSDTSGGAIFDRDEAQSRSCRAVIATTNTK